MPVNFGYLNAEEYKAIRKVVGFSQQEIQHFHGLKNIRTINQWETGRNTISLCACDKLVALSHKVYDDIKRKFWDIRKHRTQPAIFLSYDYNEDGEYIKPLIDEYHSLSVYKMTIYRAYVEALERGLDAHIVMFNKRDYESYLEALNLDDTLDNREDWARVHYLKLKRS